MIRLHTKSWGNVFALPLVESGLAVILGGVFVLLWRVRDIRRIINVPGRQNIPAEQAEGLRVALVNLLALEESFIMVWLALLYRQTMLASAGLAAGVPPILIWPFVIGILLLGLATLVVVFSHL
ncbi:MAG: hypothetical protein IMW99_10555 [Firmicutes bacterium]|nr:hypothetical protein [Bacillota bacterium]